MARNDTPSALALRDQAERWTVDCGLRVRHRREAMKWNQDDVAKRVGCRVQTISKVERGEIVPRDHLRWAIAFALVVDAEELWPTPTRRYLAKRAA